ncbi:MAG TPA: hypothetical protein DC042_01260 [Bacteroidales bacterium]|nr:hypothetical protein [Bacteroidales bacterium]
MSSPVRILASAISGYGYYYLKTLFEEIPESRACLVGVIDPTPEKSDYYSKILARGIPVYPEIEPFFLDGNRADLTVISSPIQCHVPQAISALKNGSNVLVDKPMSATVAEAEELIRIKNETGLFVEVGYQWSFSEAIQNLKRDLEAGEFGRPVRMKTICLWPRDYAYFSRNSWAGKILSPDGKVVNDSPANNACAHFLHNMFFVLGGGPRFRGDDNFNCVKSRAYDIENYDTVTLKTVAENGVELFFYASHATEHARNPEFVIECENAVISLNESTQGISATWSDGRIRNYGLPDDDHQFKKLYSAIQSVREAGIPVCPPEAAIFQTICIEKLQESPVEIVNFPIDLVVMEPGRRWVKGLYERMCHAYNKWDHKL